VRVLVTGGTGFAGSHLVKRLHKMGMKVRLIVRDKAKCNIFNGLDLEVVQGDVTDMEAVDEAVKGVEKLFHIAAVYRTAGIQDKVYRNVHVRGTENLLEASIKHGVKRFVHCSTVGVHGHIANPPANENYPFQPGDIYQKTKLEGELKAVQFGHETGLPVSVVRPCAIYGPGDMRLYKLFKMASRRIVPILGPGTIYYHMVYIDDLVNAFLLASESEKAVGEAFIAGGAEIPTLNELIQVIASVQNYRPIKVHLPVKPFQWLGSICEKICIPLNIEPPIYRRRVDFFTKSRAFDIGKAARMIGFKPEVSLRDGIERTAAWYSLQGLY
jgi:nucleoside-diphosphate-sugar epimerase